MNKINFKLKELKRLQVYSEFNIDELNRIRSNVKINKKLNDYLKNKSVILVGPSPYLKGLKKGHFIDSHDVVIRFNKGWDVIENLEVDYGSKTNIRYHCMNEKHGGLFEIEKMKDKGVDIFISQFPKNYAHFHDDILKFEQINLNRINHFQFADLEYFLNICLLINTRPNVGTSAIVDLINYDIKSLHISGFTFFLDGHYDQYNKNIYSRAKINLKDHNQEPQIKLMKLIFENIDFVTADDEIIKIFNNYDFYSSGTLIKQKVRLENNSTDLLLKITINIYLKLKKIFFK